MRLPFTLSELSVIRSGGRIFIQLMGVFAVLFGLWAATVLIDRSLESANDALDSETGEYVPSLAFPASAELIHRDGRKLNAILINRPSRDELTIQRDSDGRTFIIDLDDLSSSSADHVRKFAIQGDSRSIQALIDQFHSHLHLPETEFEFPHRCTLVSTEGVALSATLLHREDEDSIRFRRQKDGQIFTIPLDRLSKPDRQLIQQFPVGDPEEYTFDFDDG